MRECWVIEEHDKETDEWFAVDVTGNEPHAQQLLKEWRGEYSHRVVRYVPAEGLAALHQELDWMLSSLSETDTAELSASILLRWRNTLAQVVREEA